MEIWKDVIGYEEFYQISSKGRFKIKERIVSKDKRGQRLVLEKITKGIPVGKVNNRYLMVTLSSSESVKVRKVHKLVAIHFVENPYELSLVNHIDKNTFNNSKENLEWVNSMENVCHGLKSVDKKSKYIGITYSERNKNWIARITHNSKRIHLGVFSKEDEAYKCRIDFQNKNGILNRYC